MPRRGGLSAFSGSNGTTNERALWCMKTATFAAIVFCTNGTNCSASARRTMRGSVAGSTLFSASTNSGTFSSRGRMASAKSACLESTWRRTAAAVTPSSLAMSARVVASKPFAAKTCAAVARSCSLVMRGGRPIVSK